jgi:hypothetical protein
LIILLIRHILLLHPSGVPVFTSSYEKGINCCSEEHKHHTAVQEKSTLFSSFLTSMNALAGEFGGKLRHMKLGQWDVFIEGDENLIGVFLTNPSDDHVIHDFYKKGLQEIRGKFLELYKTDLNNWTGEISKFDSFSNFVNNHDIIIKDAENVKLCTSCINTVSSAIEGLDK